MTGRSAQAGRARSQPNERGLPKPAGNGQSATKEELRSLNAELAALNVELHETVERQRSAFSDLQSILISTDVVFDGSDLSRSGRRTSREVSRGAAG